MWGTVDCRQKAFELAVLVTGNHDQYGKLMRRVIREWPISCENALTDMSINRKAWIGHAAMALGYQIPEDIVRQAWRELTHEQRELANIQAANAIEAWEYEHRKGTEIHSCMGKQMLLGWDT